MVKIVLKRTIENFESLFKVTNLHINIKKDNVKIMIIIIIIIY